MALLNIGGVDMPTPSDYSATVNDISKANRNALGNMVIERITTKQTITVGWTFLSQSQVSALLTAVKPTTFNVTYPDPVLGTNRTMVCYSGDRSLGMVDFTGGTPRYKDVKFTLIEI